MYVGVYKWFLDKPPELAHINISAVDSGPRLNIKSVFPRYGESHVKDKMIPRPSYL